jgi:SAM-dependent methyltransferase
LNKEGGFILDLSSFGTNNEYERENWIRETLLTIPATCDILDAGAGTQENKKYCSHLNYTSQDFAQYNGQGDSTGLQTGAYNYGKLDIVSDITDIPRPNESFDAILCAEVLEHVPDPIKVIAELSRLLKAGGKLILTAPFCSLTHFAPYHFSTGFNRYWYEKHLDDNGLEIEEMTVSGNYFQYLGQELHRVMFVINKYSVGTHVDPKDIEAMNTVLNMLARFDKESKNSWELLCYGYFVLAQKN